MVYIRLRLKQSVGCIQIGTMKQFSYKISFQKPKKSFLAVNVNNSFFLLIHEMHNCIKIALIDS